MPISWVVTIAKQPGKFISRLDLNVGKGDIDGSRFKLIPLFADTVRPDAIARKARLGAASASVVRLIEG